MDLARALIMQFSLMVNKLNFKIGFSIMMLFSVGVYLLNVYLNMGEDISTLYSADSFYIGNSSGSYFQYFSSIFPYIVVFPFSFSYLNDQSVKVSPFLLTRMGNNYYYSKLITAFIGGFILIFIPFLVNILLNLITFPENSNTYFGYFNDINFIKDLTGQNVLNESYGYGMPFLGLYLTSPFLYNLLYLFLLSLLSGLLSIFALACSYWIKKFKVLVFIPMYLLMFVFDTVNFHSFNSAKYLNTDLLDYVSIDTTAGKSLAFYLIFCITILAFSIFRTYQVSRHDQI